MDVAKENSIAIASKSQTKTVEPEVQKQEPELQKIQPKSLSSEQKAGLQQQVRAIRPHELESLATWKNIHLNKSKSDTSKVETGFTKREIKPDSSFEYMP